MEYVRAVVLRRTRARRLQLPRRLGWGQTTPRQCMRERGEDHYKVLQLIIITITILNHFQFYFILSNWQVQNCVCFFHNKKFQFIVTLQKAVQSNFKHMQRRSNFEACKTLCYFKHVSRKKTTQNYYFYTGHGKLMCLMMCNVMPSSPQQ